MRGLVARMPTSSRPTKLTQTHQGIELKTSIKIIFLLQLYKKIFISLFHCKTKRSDTSRLQAKLIWAAAGNTLKGRIILFTIRGITVVTMMAKTMIPTTTIQEVAKNQNNRGYTQKWWGIHIWQVAGANVTMHKI